MQNQSKVSKTAATPKDAAAIILLDSGRKQVLWAQRNPKLRFLGGYHGFPGGKIDADDASVEVRNCEDSDQARYIAGAVREVFEEVGVLLVRNGEKLTNGQRVSLHDDLISGRFTFSEILESWGLWIDAEDFLYTGFWTTPEFSPMRFKTHFYVAICPPKQIPYAAITELQEVEFIEPKMALEFWSKSNVLIAPPVLIAIQELAESEIIDRCEKTKNQKPKTENLDRIAKNLHAKSSKCDGNINYIRLNSRVTCFPLRTKTLPPATHTNCFIVGSKEFVVIDAASKDKNEQEKLFMYVDQLIADGGSCKAIIVSHLHADHVGGEIALKKHFFDKFGAEIRVFAHEKTGESLGQAIHFDEFIDDEDVFKLADSVGNSFLLTALHTPGHARGHLCFYDEEFGFLLTSDNVLSLGSVLIALPEGDMTDYLSSLERMKNLPNLNFLCGSHGAANSNAKRKIQEYIVHRLEREKQILDAMNTGAQTPEKIAKIVYQNLDPNLFPLAIESVRAHIAKIEKDILNRSNL